MENNIVDYRFGDRYRVTEFVQPNNYAVQEALKSLPGPPGIIPLVNFIRDEFKYPLDSGGNPSTDGHFLRYHKRTFPPEFQFNVSRYYIWAFPAEVLISKIGYCAETANLATSLLRAKGIDAWTGLGEVRKTDDTLLGYHAWTIIENRYLLETTIHRSGVDITLNLSEAYDKTSQFAQNGNVYYFEHGRYNEQEYIGKTSLGQSGIIFQLIGKPTGFKALYEMEHPPRIKPHQLHKQWQKEEHLKHLHLLRAFGGGI